MRSEIPCRGSGPTTRPGWPTAARRHRLQRPSSPIPSTSTTAATPCRSSNIWSISAGATARRHVGGSPRISRRHDAEGVPVHRCRPALVPANLDREFYQTKDRAIRSPIPHRLRKGLKRRFPSTRRFKELEPNVLGAFRRLVGRGEHRPAAAMPFTITEDVRARSMAELEDDVRRLRGYMGLDFDGWGIA